MVGSDHMQSIGAANDREAVRKTGKTFGHIGGLADKTCERPEWPMSNHPTVRTITAMQSYSNANGQESV
jgi:hypothetical protein